MFSEFDKEIKRRIKDDDSPVDGDFPEPVKWEYTLEDDEDFREEFDRIYQDKDISEADDMFTPEIMDDTYMNMVVAIPRDTEDPDFASVTKRLKDANGLPIGTANENPILDTKLYGVEYVDGHKASLTAMLSIAIRFGSPYKVVTSLCAICLSIYRLRTHVYVCRTCNSGT